MHRPSAHSHPSTESPRIPSRLRTSALLLAIAALVASCSSVPRDSEYRILVDVISNPPGATFLGPGRTPYTTPAQIAIRDDHALTIVLKKDGYEPYLVKLKKRNRPRNLDPKNPIFFADVELALAMGREATNSLSGRYAVLKMAPNPVNVDLTPLDGSLPEYPSDAESIDGGDITCNRPIQLSQDCKGRRSATPMRRLHVRALDVRVAASESGREILVMHDNVNPVSLGLFPEGHGPDACMRVMREAHGYGPKLLHLTPIRAQDVTHGCYLEFDGNVYDSLKALTIAE